MKRTFALLSLVALAGAVTAASAHARTTPKLRGTITVSAAASLTEAFTKMGVDFQKAEGVALQSLPLPTQGDTRGGRGRLICLAQSRCRA